MRHLLSVAALLAAIVAIAPTQSARAEKFSFVALGDTAYNGARDYPVYERLIATINKSKPALTIHVGDIWGGGAGGCSDEHIEFISGFFDQHNHPLFYTPGDNEWTDCDRRAMGAWDASERLERLRDVFFSKPESLGGKKMPLVRQSDVSDRKKFRENARWFHKGVLFVTLNIPGSSNNYAFESERDLIEARERNEANVAWLRDSFRIAREGDVAGVVVAFHAEFLFNGELPLDSYNGPLNSVYGSMVRELRIAGERYGNPVLLIHGDSHQFIVDRPLIEYRGEEEGALTPTLSGLRFSAHRKSNRSRSMWTQKPRGSFPSARSTTNRNGGFPADLHNRSNYC